MNCQLVHSVRNRLRFGVEPLVNARLDAPLNLHAVSLSIAIGALICLLTACGGGSGDGLDQNGRPLTNNPPAGPSTPTADFKFLQDTVLSPVCTVCHAGGAAPLGLRLDTANAFAMLTGVASVQQPQLLRVAPGDPDNSYLVQKLEGTAAVGSQMPLGGPALDARTIALFKQWIIDGAQPRGQSAPGDTPPSVSSVSPAADSVLATGPADISAVFSQSMDESLVSDITFVLQNSGGDGTFGDGNEQTIAPVSVLLTSVQAIRMDLATVNLVDDVYQARLIGTGATALANPGGLILDGDADGVQGGDFVWQFTVDSGVATPLPTWRWIQDNVFTAICTQCHIAGGIAAFLPLDEANSFTVMANVPSLGVPTLDRIEPGDPDNSFLIQKLRGTAATGAQMPLGLPPLDADVIGAISTWIVNGVPLAPGDPMPDVTPPVVSLAVPASPVSGVVTLTATATDDMAVTTVRFLVDGVSIGTGSSAPFDLSWDTTALSNGSYTLTAEADDAAGNTGTTTPAVITLDNLPAVDNTPPAVTVNDPGSPLSGVVNLMVSASDNIAVSRVSLLIDDVVVTTFTTAPFDFSWDTSQVTNGTHSIRAQAEDATGNLGESAQITVTVDNGLPPDTEAPGVTILTPAVSLSGITEVTLSATDNIGVTVVRLFVDGLQAGSDNAAPYTVAWDTTTATDGNHLLSAEAEDAAGNIGFSTTLVANVQNGGPQPDFDWIQQNVFTAICTACHVEGGIAAFLQLDQANSINMLINIPSIQMTALDRVEPGQPDLSYLVQKLEGSAQVGAQMPLGGTPLPANIITAIRQWISNGANTGFTDTIAPVVVLGALPSSATGTVTLTADAVDDVGVTTVRFVANGVVVASDSIGPYTVDWDTTSVADGRYLLFAQADDTAGNTGASLIRAVIISNGVIDTELPTVAINPVTPPANGVVTVSVQASDNVGIVDVGLSVDGVVIGSDNTSPFEFVWDTTVIADGVHTLLATATDAVGNIGSTLPLTITVDNSVALDTTPPIISIDTVTSPASGSVAVSLQASDDTAVTVVRLFVDGILLGTDAIAPYVIQWDSTLLPDGMHVLTAEAEDAAGNIGTAGAPGTNVSNAAGAQPTWRWIQDNIFTPQCVVCHVAGGAADFLHLTEQDSYTQLVNVPSTEGGPQFRVLPDSPDNSSLVQRLEGALSPQMPLGGAMLPADQIAAVRQWILNGALSEVPADASPPTVSLVSPGSIVSGTVTVLATAVDDVGVTSVRIFVDGVLLASDTTAPFEATWDTTLTNDGPHTLTAAADDAAGNTGNSADLNVTIDNTIPPDTTAPSVSIQAVNNPVSGTVTIDIDATDSVGVTRVSLSVDGIEMGTDVTLPYQIPLHTLALPNGDHLLIATASDAAGNTSTSSPVTVNVSNLEPVISVIAQAPQSVIRGDDFTVVATLSNAGVDSGELTAVLNFTPSDLLRIEEPGAAQTAGVIPANGMVPVVWLLRGDDVGVATITVNVTDATNSVVAQYQITVTVVD